MASNSIEQDISEIKTRLAKMDREGKIVNGIQIAFIALSFIWGVTTLSGLNKKIKP